MVVFEAGELGSESGGALLLNLVSSEGNVGRIVAGQSGNRVCCPHPEEIKPDIAESYLQVGVTEDHVRQIAQAQPKCDYLIQAGSVDR